MFRNTRPLKIRILAFCLLLIGTIGCDQYTASVTAKVAIKWEAYVSADKKFQIELPGAPEPWVTHFDSPNYGRTEVQHVSTVANETMFGVAYNDYPRPLSDEEVESELKLTYTLPGTGAEILETSKVKVANQPAIEVVAKTGPIISVARYFIADSQRLYSLQIGGQNDPRQDPESVERFFGSFQLVNDDRQKASTNIIAPVDRSGRTGEATLQAYATTPAGDLVDAGPAPIEPSGSQVKLRTSLKLGDRVQVRWDGRFTLPDGRIVQESWWLGTIIGLEKDGRVKIHYTGWDSAWDEVLTRERLRLEGKGTE